MQLHSRITNKIKHSLNLLILMHKRWWAGRRWLFDHLIIFSSHFSVVKTFTRPAKEKSTRVLGCRFYLLPEFFPSKLGQITNIRFLLAALSLWRRTRAERARAKVNTFMDFILYYVIHVSKNFISLSKFFLSFRLLCLRSLPSWIFFFLILIFFRGVREKSKDLHA